MTGALAAFGEQVMKGAQAAADRINAEGGINGQQIVLIRGDDGADPQRAGDLANKWIGQDQWVVGVVGHVTSSAAIAASQIYARAGLLRISPAATNLRVTAQQPSQCFQFRVCGGDDQQAATAVDHIVDSFKAQKVAVIHDDDYYGTGLGDAVRGELMKRGASPILYEGITVGQTDFSAVVTKLRDAAVDTLFFAGRYAEAGTLLRQIREQGLTMLRFVAGDAIATDQFVTAAGGAKIADGAYMIFEQDPRNRPEARAVVDEFRKAGTEPEGYTLHAYAAMQVAAAAFNGAGANIGPPAAQWLQGNKVQTILGTKEWTSSGDLVHKGGIFDMGDVTDGGSEVDTTFAVYQWDSNGKYQQLGN